MTQFENDTPRPSQLHVWLLAARPKTLWAAVAPVLIGTAMAHCAGGVHVLSAVVCLMTALTLQIGTNFANDYFDFLKGADTPDRQGPLRVTQAGLVRPQSVRNAFIVTFSFAALGAVWLGLRAGPVLILIGVLAIASGIFYTAGPRPLGYMGLGDIFAFVFFGPVAVGGTYYVQTLAFRPASVVAGVAPGLFAVAMLAVNNLRDIDGDREAGKRTMAVRFGRRFARWEYGVAIVGAALVPVLLWSCDQVPMGALAGVLVLPASVPSLKRVFSADGGRLNKALAWTGMLMILYSVLFSAGAVFFRPPL